MWCWSNNASFHLAFAWIYCWYILVSRQKTNPASQSHYIRFPLAENKNAKQMTSILILVILRCNVPCNLCFPLCLKLYKHSVKQDSWGSVHYEAKSPTPHKTATGHLQQQHQSSLSICVKEILYCFWSHMKDIFMCSICCRNPVLIVLIFHYLGDHSYKYFV